MSDIRFYADEHVAIAVTTGLRLRRVDIVTVQEAGLAGAGDEVHLAFALEEARVIFTQDGDFLGLPPKATLMQGLSTPHSAHRLGILFVGSYSFIGCCQPRLWLA